MDTVDLSIIVVNWNTRDLLRDCLSSVYSTIKGLQFETIVVDNGSTDGSVELVEQEFPSVHLITNRSNLGFAAANNQAYASAADDTSCYSIAMPCYVETRRQSWLLY